MMDFLFTVMICHICPSKKLMPVLEPPHAGPGIFKYLNVQACVELNQHSVGCTDIQDLLVSDYDDVESVQMVFNPFIDAFEVSGQVVVKLDSFTDGLELLHMADNQMNELVRPARRGLVWVACETQCSCPGCKEDV